MVYRKAYCYECVQCGNVYPCKLPYESIEYCPECDGVLSTVSCLPESVPPVHTVYWKETDFHAWEYEQKQRRRRLQALENLS